LYSRRTGTPAARMPDQVPDNVANERFQRLLSLVQEVGRKESGKLTGRTMPVRVDEMNRQDKHLVTGRLMDNTVVHFPGGRELIGEIGPVFRRESKGFYYLGERS
ncbi:MAG: tRNA (N6-isopentenyl adenosine(37)-C2)-methylthiotransferase MiaB, partial [Lachnospiraceae bacterium]|nr:tRNA (N6-isopentenyl adenosine(37)-C2)-methylthiotransferase MiaB [Lachnospiraceae bacterium]